MRYEQARRIQKQVVARFVGRDPYQPNGATGNRQPTDASPAPDDDKTKDADNNEQTTNGE